jgi:hypothetical protein
MEEYVERRLPSQHFTSIRVGKRFNVRQVALDFNLNVDNVLNANTITGLNNAAGPTFEAITGILPPRILRLGTTVAF